MLRTLLPPTSFVPFTARRLAGALEVWRNPELPLPSPGGPLDHACVIGDGHDGEPRTLLAERYGGRGIFNNGGGVRCGLDGAVQIKGIGRNPLAGRDASYWYSHGCATLEESVREAIWGEVCDAALPGGGARAYAVLATGGTAPVEGPGGAVTHEPRGLVLREAKLRPAHYMRSILFAPGDDFDASCVCDVARTEAAVRALPHGLAATYGVAGADAAGVLAAGLHAFAARCAGQLAAARAKRIVHGALSCSNVGLDGSFLDYGTITTVSDYGRVIVARAHPDAWLEPAEMMPTIKELAFYVVKYSGAISASIDSAELLAQFDRMYRRRAAVEFLKLTGIPEERLSLVPAAPLNELYACFLQITADGALEPFKLSEMPAKMADASLNAALRALAFARDEAHADELVSPIVANTRLRRRLVALFWAAIRAYLAQLPAAMRAGAGEFVAFNALRLNTAYEELYRPNLVRAIRSAAASGGPDALGSLIGHHQARGRFLLGEVRHRRFRADAWFGEACSISEAEGVRLDTGGDWRDRVRSLRAPSQDIDRIAARFCR